MLYFFGVLDLILNLQSFFFFCVGFDVELFLAVEVVEKKVDVEQENELVLDGGFVVPESNAFGHTFR